jgi:hypothetical protein
MYYNISYMSEREEEEDVRMNIRLPTHIIMISE